MRKLEVVQEIGAFPASQTWVRFNNDNFVLTTYGSSPETRTTVWRGDWQGNITGSFTEYENTPHSEAIVKLEQFLQSKERIKRDKRNLAAREKYEVYKTLGLKRTPYGWE